MEKQMIKHQTIPETVNDRIQLIGQEAETKIKRERERWPGNPQRNPFDLLISSDCVLCRRDTCMGDSVPKLF